MKNLFKKTKNKIKSDYLFFHRSKSCVCNQPAHLPRAAMGGHSSGHYCHPASAQTGGHPQNNR